MRERAGGEGNEGKGIEGTRGPGQLVRLPVAAGPMRRARGLGREASAAVVAAWRSSGNSRRAGRTATGKTMASSFGGGGMLRFMHHMARSNCCWQSYCTCGVAEPAGSQAQRGDPKEDKKNKKRDQGREGINRRRCTAWRREDPGRLA